MSQNFKKIIFSIAIILLLSVSGKILAITIADIELLIAIGVIPAENAESARNYIAQQKAASSNVGNLVTTNPNSTNQCLILKQNLVKGKSGTAVTALQKFLKSEGYFPKDQNATGYFGDVTLDAVANFQIATGLIKTNKQIGAGTVGPTTSGKIQEVSCKKSSDETIASSTKPIINSTSTPSILDTNIFTGTQTPVVQKFVGPVLITLIGDERFVGDETGRLLMKYTTSVKPEKIATTLDVMTLCDPSAIKLSSTVITECGKIYEIDIVNDKKSFSVNYENKSRFIQSIIFTVEVFDQDKNSLGIKEVRSEVPTAKPIIELEVNGTVTKQVGIGPIQNRVCTQTQQLDFIRYTMSPYDPFNPISLPICWPGELLCNKSNPPTYCKITAGASSDDLCLKTQKFENGKCVSKE